MYFPYLFARRFELLALRELADDLPIATTVVPIIEPISRTLGDLKRCLKALGSAGIRAIVVINPHQGEFKEGPSSDLRAGIAEEFGQYASIVPGLLCNQETNPRAVAQFLEDYQSGEIALLYWNPRFSEVELRNILREPRIRYNVVLHGRISEALRSLLPRQAVVDVQDHFNARPRNSEYDGAEFFSDSHLNLRRGSLGYGDYLTIGSTYRKGGGPAHAVAIHAVYKQSGTNQVWVEHFVSDDIELEVGTTPEKFLQAARKLARAVSRRRTEFGDDAALTAFANYVRQNSYPGLGASKKLQIYHQVALNHKTLRGEF